MKVPTKMLGKGRPDLALLSPEYRLNESPSKKEGKSALLRQMSVQILCLNESPSKKEGKSALAREGMLGESDPQ